MSESASVCVLYQQQIAAALAQLRFNSALTVQPRDGDCDGDGGDDALCACIERDRGREKERECFYCCSSLALNVA